MSQGSSYTDSQASHITGQYYVYYRFGTLVALMSKLSIWMSQRSSCTDFGLTAVD